MVIFLKLVNMYNEHIAQEIQHVHVNDENPGSTMIDSRTRAIRNQSSFFRTPASYCNKLKKSQAQALRTLTKGATIEGAV